MYPIQPIDAANRGEAVALLAEAFRDHPMVPADKHGKRSLLMIKAIADAFATAPDARWLGLRHEGKLACVAFVYADGSEPPLRQLPRMMLRMLRVVGLKRFIKYMRLMSVKHEGDDKRLQLMLLGTHSQLQAKGFGRAMMRHVFEHAKSLGYEAVTLEVAKHTPAFGFYQSEGFELEKEIPLDPMPLCFMKCKLTQSSDATTNAPKE